MNAYDAAHSLARALKGSKEYTEFMEKRKIVYGNPKTKDMIEDFRNKAMELQMAQLQGENVDEEKVEKIKKLENVMMENPIINDFFQAEMRFSQLMNDIYKILADAMDISE